VILVAGGTGRLGSLVVARLTALGEPVRVLTRDRKGAEALGAAVDVVVGDVRDRASLDAAVAEVGTVVSAVHGFAGPGRGTPRSVDRDGNAHLVAAAETVGARVVLVSVAGASADHPMELFRMKAAAEKNLEDAGVAWTVVRAGPFLELYLDLLRQTAAKTGRPLVFGAGNNPINFVPVGDVATAVTTAVLDPTQRGNIVVVGGPQNRTMNELAAAVQRELGTTGKSPRHVPRAVLRTMAATRHLTHAAGPRLAQAALIMDTTDMTDAIAPEPTATG
jgi:NADH dehydrogenase